MDPNSRNQCWSFWEYRVYPDALHRPTYATVKTNIGRFGRLIFGSASSMHIRCVWDAGRLCWEVKVISEGHPVQDPRYTEWVHAQWKRFFASGFGQTAEVRVHARLAAGEHEGQAPDQLIVLPALSVGEM